jgi:hypothetical protein
MRQIEQNITSAIRSNKKSFAQSNTTITYNNDTDTYDVYLHGHRIAQIDRNECSVKLWSCGYQTNVTKSRLNCVLDGLYTQKGIWQKNGVWYIGTHCNYEEFVDGMKIYF